MSTSHFPRFAFFALLTALVALPLPLRAAGADGPLAPYRDDQFAGQAVLSSDDNGDFEVLDYQELRDINGRDRIPERRVKDAYVSLGVRRQQQNQTLSLPNGTLQLARVGVDQGQAFTVIFIHGRGGDRRLGVNDFTFGGNFNRLKNLVVRAHATYYAPSVPAFDTGGVALIGDLIAHAKSSSGGKPVVLACASMGSILCWGAARDQTVVDNLAGMMIMGGAPDPDYAKSAGYAAKLPIYFTHGGNDPVYAPDAQIALYRKLHARGEATRFRLFATGSHGTPVRMTDWREALNFLLTR
ncbi:alpha/beta hydrolase [Rhizobium halophytocola]|uniref:Alpha/beta hydrolase n=1 Tax=Rhizobium halophytocola TaxID=735519 RepID=A0ABS4DWB3_9HYPH|nr:alpha/beta hydrolase [Rhizobium halophytocola]MBP1849991.1 hypothetical protein [Rhizobium halophytocola]